MTFHYDDDTTSQAFKIERIAYGENDSAAIQPPSEVRFLYAARPDRRSTYQAGAGTNLMHRLTGIQTYTGASLVRSYGLAYGTSPATGRSRLLPHPTVRRPLVVDDLLAGRPTALIASVVVAQRCEACPVAAYRPKPQAARRHQCWA